MALFLIASAILALLGLVHGLLAARDLWVSSFFTPTDREIQHAMRRGRVRLAPQMSIWRAWQGFNLSHSVGLLGLGLVGIALGTTRGSLGSWQARADGFFILVSGVYFALAVRFWFRVPVIACAIATACFLAAALFG